MSALLLAWLVSSSSVLAAQAAVQGTVPARTIDAVSVLGGETEGIDPHYGVCVVHPTFAGCMQCCATDGLFDALWGAVCSGVARVARELTRAGGEGVDAACGVLTAEDRCEVNCEGKNGDPTPTFCGTDESPGVCKAVCDDPAHNAGSCVGGLTCCAYEYRPL